MDRPDVLYRYGSATALREKSQGITEDSHSSGSDKGKGSSSSEEQKRDKPHNGKKKRTKEKPSSERSSPRHSLTINDLENSSSSEGGPGGKDKRPRSRSGRILYPSTSFGGKDEKHKDSEKCKEEKSKEEKPKEDKHTDKDGDKDKDKEEGKHRRHDEGHTSRKSSKRNSGGTRDSGDFMIEVPTSASPSPLLASPGSRARQNRTKTPKPELALQLSNKVNSFLLPLVPVTPLKLSCPLTLFQDEEKRPSLGTPRRSVRRVNFLFKFILFFLTPNISNFYLHTSALYLNISDNIF
jgi:hypothetical protein